MEALVQDFRYALRTLLKSPSFAITAILTLALGIGANTALYSIVDAVVFRPLPFHDSGRLLMLWQTRPPAGDQNLVNPRNYMAWSHAKSFDRLAAIAPIAINVTGAGEPAGVFGGRVPANFFPTLGVEPRLGRGFLAEEDRPGVRKVALLSDNFWRKQFGADPNVIGRGVALNGEAYTVIGVLPHDFEFITRQFDLWTPLALNAGANSDANTLMVMARLAPGVSIDAARAEMRVIAAQMATAFPDTNRGWGVRVMTLPDFLIGDVRTPLLLLLGAVTLVLLIACGNVANLLLTRSIARVKEIAVRSALGAGQARLIGQLLIESLIIGVFGAAVGVMIAYAAVHGLLALPALDLPRAAEIRMNWQVMLFALGLAIVTGLIFGLAPARQLLRFDLNGALRESGRSAIGARAHRRFGSAIVVVEVALSLVLLIGSGLLVRSLLRFQHLDRGFSSSNVLSMRFSISARRYPSEARVIAYVREIVRRLRTLPGIEAVGISTGLPLDMNRHLGMPFTVEGQPPGPNAHLASASVQLVNADYFRAVRLPLVAGRFFDDAIDREDTPGVVVISASLARRLFHGQNPVGRHLVMGIPMKGDSDVAREIVGVAGDVAYTVKESAASQEIYMPYWQGAVWPNLYISLRTNGAPASLAQAAPRAIRSVDPEQPVADVLMLADRAAKLGHKSQLNTVISVSFGVLALSLAALGIYGVVSYSAAQRTSEIGVRMALGAEPSGIMRLVVGEAARLVLFGLGIGMIAYGLLAKLIASILFETAPTDSVVLLGASAVLAAVALLAAYVPARRAARIDPMRALRNE